jgi:hypothetical protein
VEYQERFLSTSSSLPFPPPPIDSLYAEVEEFVQIGSDARLQLQISRLSVTVSSETSTPRGVFNILTTPFLIVKYILSSFCHHRHRLVSIGQLRESSRFRNWSNRRSDLVCPPKFQSRNWKAHPFPPSIITFFGYSIESHCHAHSSENLRSYLDFSSGQLWRSPGTQHRPL